MLLLLRQWSFIHIHNLRIESFSFTLKSLRSSPFFFRARSRVKWSFAGALVLSFPIRSFLFRASMVVHSAKERVGGGVRSLALPSLFVKLANNHTKPPWLDSYANLLRPTPLKASKKLGVGCQMLGVRCKPVYEINGE